MGKGRLTHPLLEFILSSLKRPFIVLCSAGSRHFKAGGVLGAAGRWPESWLGEGGRGCCPDGLCWGSSRWGRGERCGARSGRVQRLGEEEDGLYL